MFCFGALRQAGSIAKCLCGCLFCLLCGGPILLIVGIVILTAPNTREDDVKEYNSVVGAYNHLESDSWTPGNIGGATTALATEQIMIKGDDEGIVTAASRFARAYVSSQPSNVTYTITTILPFSRTPFYTQQRTAVGQCRFDSCLYGNGVVCPTTSTWSGPNRCEQGTCGTCTYNVYLSKYCVAVKKNDAGPPPSPVTWSLDTTTTCFYNSDSILVNTNPSTVEFQVRQRGDPYIALQRITKGSEDFGITSGQQTVMGLTLIIIGAVMIAGMCAVAFIVYKLVKKFIVKDDEDNNGVAEMGNYGGNGGGGNNNNNNSNAPTFTPTNQYYKPQHASSAPSSHLPSSRQHQQGSTYNNNTAVQGQPLGYQHHQQPTPPPPPGTPSYFGSVPGTVYHPHAISPRPPGQV